MNNEFKKDQLAKLAGYLKSGYLKEVETGYKSGTRLGKRVTDITMTFKVRVRGIVLPDEDEG